jgi:hypothetical protein
MRFGHQVAARAAQLGRNGSFLGDLPVSALAARLDHRLPKRRRTGTRGRLPLAQQSTSKLMGESLVLVERRC